MIFHQPFNSKMNFNYNAYIYSNTGYDSHFHSNYELIYVFEGEMQVFVNAREFILRGGNTLLISPFAVHSFKVPADTRAWVGVFSKDFVADFASKNGHRQFSSFTLPQEQVGLLKTQLFFEGKPEHYSCKAFLYLVCAECKKQAKVISSENKGFRDAVISTISREFQNDISLKELAENLGYEYHYFSSLFHKCFNMDYKKFINLFRFERACKLLETENQAITEIYTLCGFSSLRNFNRVFKEMSGITPLEYKRNLPQ